jgi:iron complex outermembrane receptor protein
MNIFDIRKFLMSVSVLVGISTLAFVPQALAQDDEAGEVEEITVTGSRIKRDTFSTTTPIQVLNTENAQRIGIASISELLQKSTASSGQQVDAGISTNAGQTNASEAPPDGGVGSACINLRGLGCERTLVLVNGKRLGVAGIRGAPPQPDINMLPIGMVEGVDLLTGGLSTVYGADAVAGVVNVRLKKDFEGLNLTVNTEIPNDDGGEIYQASLVGGVGNDLGNVTFGMEYSRQERVRTGDRSYSDCLRVSHRGLSRGVDTGNIQNDCASWFPDNWVDISIGANDPIASGAIVRANGEPMNSLDQYYLMYTPGASDLEWSATGAPVTGFSSFAACGQTDGEFTERFPLEPGDGEYWPRFYFSDGLCNDQVARANADLWRPYERFSLVVNGHLDPGWGGNSELYFEGYYFNRQNFIIGANEQIFPTIVGEVPLVDSLNNIIPDANGAPQMFCNPLNPFCSDVDPIVTTDSLPQTFDTELQQIRLVTGITGDITDDGRWSYDVSASYDRATGFVSQPILLENHLYLATQQVGVVEDFDNPGQPSDLTVCGFRDVSNGAFFTQPECVPLDLLNARQWADGQGSLGTFTPAEEDFLIGNRTNRTTTDIMSFQGYVFGDLWDLPSGGTVGSAFGVEYRVDQIKSHNSAAGEKGLNAAENALQEGATFGDRSTFDVYGEISAPLVIDAGWADLFQVDLAIRFTDDENFGNETVYKAGFLWDINEYLSLSSSFNTSFRAPNLREQFLADQAGALSGSSDPCHNNIWVLLDPSPARDRLEANCNLAGVDPNTLGTGFTVAIPTTLQGAATLKPETSDSFTTTITASQPWFERFDFDMAVTYFDIQIDDSVQALDPQQIANRCYNDEDNLASPFCDRVERNRPTSPPEAQFISLITAGFINTGTETAVGYDITTRFMMDFDEVNLNWSTASTFMDEREFQLFPDSPENPGGSAIIDNVGRIGSPEFTFQSTVALAFRGWDVIWQSRWFSDTEYPEGQANPVLTDENNLCLTGCPLGTDPDDSFSEWTQYQTTNDFRVVDGIGRDGLSQWLTEAEGQWHHDLAVTYNWEMASVTIGVNNLTDEEPPLISWSAGPTRNNAVSSARYDLVGRTAFARVVVNF